MLLQCSSDYALRPNTLIVENFLNIILCTMGEVNVCFQIDTDNRENFTSAAAFQTFRKQRDAFYDILKIWEENHSVSGWVFQIALGGKIRGMLTMHNDSTNYYHIARLFKSQLLISCIKNGHQVSWERSRSPRCFKVQRDNFEIIL